MRNRIPEASPTILRSLAALGCSLLLVLASACSGSGANAIQPAPTADSALADLSLQRDSDVPPLPFPDNPDPNACGIPAPYGGRPGWVTGVYQGQTIEPTVLLYDSHVRLHITGAVASGTPVQVDLYQTNPVLDFYYVQADTPNGVQKGWVPAPFVEFTPPADVH